MRLLSTDDQAEVPCPVLRCILTTARIGYQRQPFREGDNRSTDRLSGGRIAAIPRTRPRRGAEPAPQRFAQPLE